MIDTDAFLTTLYVSVDDFFQQQNPAGATRPGPAAALTASEVVTLALFGQWAGFGGERGYWRWASRHLRGAFPKLPVRSQFNRQVRAVRVHLEAFAVHLAARLGAPTAAYQAMDLSAAPTRDAKRRGGGWLEGQAALGLSKRLGWFEGFWVLAAVSPAGVVSGFCFAPGNVKDQPLAEDFLSARAANALPFAALPTPTLASAGVPANAPYALDKGFEGRDWHARWRRELAVEVICAPKRPRGQAVHPWPKAARRWLSSVRQIVETVFDKLHHAFALSRERPHCVQGFGARLAARVGLHNFCILLNQQLGRPNLAFADLVDW